MTKTYPKVSMGCTVPATTDLFTIAIRLENNDTNVPCIMRTIGEDAETACILVQNNTSFEKYKTPCESFSDVEKFVNDNLFVDTNVAMTSSLQVFLEKAKMYYDTI